MSVTRSALRPPLGGIQARVLAVVAAIVSVVALVGLGAPAASAGAATGVQNGVAAINPEPATPVGPGAAVSPGRVGVSGLLFDDGAVVSLVTPRG
ncbi:hypothetical protein, partial [Mycobacterium sp.]|uniref:hypothetical protein n=1 Tax=Mycobacterium sp. TaxID=1785 RepID=UPI003A88D5C2